ncbi:MAG: type II toxin-antitoxin system VapC family toxin [Burkholderiales bacterium]|jgi:tRNA(fMet)-specific endonuclease VapC|nr:type II toxin-antitoxin system VapC family toxin [Burkholderiales bacterium]
MKLGEAVISIVTWGELIYGASKSAYRADALRTLDAFAALIPVAGMTENVGRTYGTIRADLEAKGQPIGNNDLWIAAHAKALGLPLVTNNEKEFQRVSGLKVLNWVS